MGMLCFHWYKHLATTFVPSVCLEDGKAHVGELSKFTQQTLNGSRQNLSLLNPEMSLKRKLSSKKRMDLDIITALQDGICAIV